MKSMTVVKIVLLVAIILLSFNCKDSFTNTAQIITQSNVIVNSNNLSTGLIAHYSFEGNTNDTSGNGKNGTAIGQYSYVSGKQGLGISLIGDNAVYHSMGGYVQIPPLDTSALTALTISIWVKEDTLYEPTYGEAYISFSGDASYAWCGIGHLYGKIQFAVGATDSLGIPLPVAPISIAFDPSDMHKWAHYSLVYDHGVLTAYKNGVPQMSIPQQLHICGSAAFIASHTWGGSPPCSSDTIFRNNR